METNDTFEASFFVDTLYPDDVSSWPEDVRTLMGRAIDRLLAQHPDRSVVSERTYCMDSTHPRFPNNMPEKLAHKKFALVHEVTIDSPVPVDA